MTDEPARPASTTPQTPAPASRASVMPADFARKRDFLPLLYLIGFVVLAGSLVFLWQNPPVSDTARQQSTEVEQLKGQVANLGREIAAVRGTPAPVSQADFAKLQQQVAALGARPEVAPAALQSLSQKVDALASKPAADPAAVQQLSDKVAALDGRKVVTPDQLASLSDQLGTLRTQMPDLKPLDGRVAALEARPTVDPAAINGKLNDLSGQVQKAQTAESDLATRLDAADKRATAQLDQLKSQLDALTQRAHLTARLQGMAAALAAGQKLGDIPGAPPALARFANQAPPTEATLRESFDRYADAAQKANNPVTTKDQGFGSRLWTRAQQAVTVRQGDNVLVGDPIAGVIASARDKLDNGDLAGAVDALKPLNGPAAAAMKPWTDQAQSLVAARAAIASLAAN